MLFSLNVLIIKSIFYLLNYIAEYKVERNTQDIRFGKYLAQRSILVKAKAE